MTDSSEEPEEEIGGALPAAVVPPETKPKRPGIKELVQRYGSLALGIYLTTFLVALSLGMITFGLFLDPSSWQTEGADPPWLIAKFADLTGADSGWFWFVTTAGLAGVRQGLADPADHADGSPDPDRGQEARPRAERGGHRDRGRGLGASGFGG